MMVCAFNPSAWETEAGESEFKASPVHIMSPKPDVFLNQCSIATLIKQSISLGLTYSFRDLVHSHHGGKHGGTQADMVLER